MATTSDNNLEPTTTVVVTIRIPCGADSDLVTDAEERLSRRFIEIQGEYWLLHPPYDSDNLNH